MPTSTKIINKLLHRDGPASDSAPSTPRSPRTQCSPSSPTRSCASEGVPPPVYLTPLQRQEDMITQFWGGRPQYANPSPKPPAYRAPSRDDADLEKLPPYTAGSKEKQSKEPSTYAKYMFKYGFFFPLFWFLGFITLWAPLYSTGEWQVGEGEEEKRLWLQEIKKAEMKWGRRCMWAAITFTFVVIVAVVVALAVIKSR